MKLIAVGDIHGRSIWQYIIQKENPDHIVCIGDNFDSSFADKIEIEELEKRLEYLKNLKK